MNLVVDPLLGIHESFELEGVGHGVTRYGYTIARESRGLSAAKFQCDGWVLEVGELEGCERLRRSSKPWVGWLLGCRDTARRHNFPIYTVHPCGSKGS